MGTTRGPTTRRAQSGRRRGCGGCCGCCGDACGLAAVFGGLRFSPHKLIGLNLLRRASKARPREIAVADGGARLCPLLAQTLAPRVQLARDGLRADDGRRGKNGWWVGFSAFGDSLKDKACGQCEMAGMGRRKGEGGRERARLRARGPRGPRAPRSARDVGDEKDRRAVSTLASMTARKQ